MISIIIVNYNSGGDLKKCLNALAKQTYQQFEIIIIDNNSTDDSIANITCDIIKLSENIGFAAANNIGAKKAQYGWIATLNPDAFPMENWLEELVKAINKYPEYQAFGSTQLDASDPSILDGFGDVYHILGFAYRAGKGHKLTDSLSDRKIFSPCAAAALYKKTVFLELGGFDEMLFCYMEDVDLGFRMNLAGYKSMQLREALVLHVGSASSSKISGFAEYHGNRNKILVYIKNMPMIILIPLLPLHLALEISFAIAKLNKNRLIAIYDAFKMMPNINRSKRKISISKMMHIFLYSFKVMINRDIPN